jgi:hypothetical protein
VTIAALFIGILIVAQGIAGLASPEMFVSIVRTFQVAPMIYFAAIVRVLIGLVLVRAAPASRAPRSLTVLGILIVVGGLLTPFIGAEFAKMALGWWSEGGPMVVRAWACASLLIGGFIVFATARISKVSPDSSAER